VPFPMTVVKRRLWKLASAVEFGPGKFPITPHNDRLSVLTGLSRRENAWDRWERRAKV